MWRLKRGNEEWEVDNLGRWAREGRIKPSDYLFNPVLGRWMYAKDVEEIRVLITPRPSQVDPGRVVLLLLIVLAVLYLLDKGAILVLR